MAAELFTLDRSNLDLVAAADPMGFLGQISTAAQACRAAFLAANVGALTWDKERWPELTLGVWSDEEQPHHDAGRRRRTTSEDESAELSTWLQLRPAWPQLGGPSIAWPIGGATGRQGYDDRIEDLVDAVVTALNTVYRRTLHMAEVLSDAPAPAPAEPAVRPDARPALTSTESHATLTGPAPEPAPDTEALEQALLETLPEARMFTASGVAHSETEVGEVLATLARGAESAGRRESGAVRHLDHSVTPLPSGLEGLSTNGKGGRFLVTVTATIHLGA